MKYVSLIRRREGLSREAFRDYYEQIHAPLALRFFPPKLYQRNHLDNPPNEQPFDCLSEFIYADDFDPMGVLQTEVGSILAADERNFMDREHVRSACAQPLRLHLPAGEERRAREIWLFAPGTLPAAILQAQLQSVFDQLVAQLESGQGASLDWLTPYYCDDFPYAALLAVEGRCSAALPAELAELSPTRLWVSTWPSSRG